MECLMKVCIWDWRSIHPFMQPFPFAFLKPDSAPWVVPRLPQSGWDICSLQWVLGSPEVSGRLWPESSLTCFLIPINGKEQWTYSRLPEMSKHLIPSLRLSPTTHLRKLVSASCMHCPIRLVITQSSFPFVRVCGLDGLITPKLCLSAQLPFHHCVLILHRSVNFITHSTLEILSLTIQYFLHASRFLRDYRF